MSSYFGGSSGVQLYAMKMRWLVGGLLSLVFILTILITIVALKVQKQPEVVAQDHFVPPKNNKAVEMVVTVGRVEEGARLQPNMFQTVSIQEDSVPITALRKKDISVVLNKYAARLINANSPILLEHVTENPPRTAVRIPPGYRAIAIHVNERSAVSGYVTPNSRVDVLLTYQKNRGKKVTTLARFVKVISVDGNTRSTQHNKIGKQGTTVTLLVTEKDSMRVELARNMGELSLSLLGDGVGPTAKKDSETIDSEEIFGDNHEPAETYHPGIMYTNDAKTGRSLRYLLRNGRWMLDREYSL